MFAIKNIGFVQVITCPKCISQLYTTYDYYRFLASENILTCYCNMHNSANMEHNITSLYKNWKKQNTGA